MGVCAGLYAGVAGAQSIVLYQDKANFSSGNGGEFEAVYSGSLPAGLPSDFISQGYVAGKTAGLDGRANSFQTFCIQTSVTFGPGSSYSWVVAPPATSPSGAAINWGTGWLYSQFAQGKLANYDYTGNTRVTSAGELQLAIWYIQGQTGSLDGTTVNEGQGNVTGQVFYDAAAAAALAAKPSLANSDSTVQAANILAYLRTAATAANPDPFNVADLVMYTGSDPSQSPAQNQLVLVPEPTTMVAGMLLLLPFGVSTLRFVRKNRAAV